MIIQLKHVNYVLMQLKIANNAIQNFIALNVLIPFTYPWTNLNVYHRVLKIQVILIK